MRVALDVGGGGTTVTLSLKTRLFALGFFVGCLTAAAVQPQGNTQRAPDPNLSPTSNGVFQTATAIGLVSGDTVVAFDKRSGRLSSVVRRGCGREFVSARAARPLFRLVLTKPAGFEAASVTAEQFRNVSVSQAGETRLELNFADHASLPLTV
ncbi:MAG: hypothetical protein N3B01_06215, partial [Verrucomicrobiae bacterium]|nr:hypothetical protein [Verrucomicrobiae bacterium]